MNTPSKGAGQQQKASPPQPPPESPKPPEYPEDPYPDAVIHRMPRHLALAKAAEEGLPDEVPYEISADVLEYQFTLETQNADNVPRCEALVEEIESIPDEILSLVQREQLLDVLRIKRSLFLKDLDHLNDRCTFLLLELRKIDPSKGQQRRIKFNEVGKEIMIYLEESPVFTEEHRKHWFDELQAFLKDRRAAPRPALSAEVCGKIGRYRRDIKLADTSGAYELVSAAIKAEPEDALPAEHKEVLLGSVTEKRHVRGLRKATSQEEFAAIREAVLADGTLTDTAQKELLKAIEERQEEPLVVISETQRKLSEIFDGLCISEEEQAINKTRSAERRAVDNQGRRAELVRFQDLLLRRVENGELTKVLYKGWMRKISDELMKIPLEKEPRSKAVPLLVVLALLTGFGFTGHSLGWFKKIQAQFSSSTNTPAPPAALPPEENGLLKKLQTALSTPNYLESVDKAREALSQWEREPNSPAAETAKADWGELIMKLEIRGLLNSIGNTELQKRLARTALPLLEAKGPQLSLLQEVSRLRNQGVKERVLQLVLLGLDETLEKRPTKQQNQELLGVLRQELNPNNYTLAYAKRSVKLWKAEASNPQQAQNLSGWRTIVDNLTLLQASENILGRVPLRD